MSKLIKCKICGVEVEKTGRNQKYGNVAKKTEKDTRSVIQNASR